MPDTVKVRITIVAEIKSDEFDFYQWIHEENRMKLLDEAIAAPVRYALSLEKEGKMVTSYGVTQR